MGALSDPKAEHFCRFIVQGKTKREAAELAGYSKKTASACGSRLFKRVNVSERIQELQSQVSAKLVAKSVERLDLEISARVNRVKAQEDRWHRLQRLLDARAADPAMANVPGGDTGLYRKRVTVSGTGEHRKVSIEYIVDTPTLKIMLEHEKQAAIESGQWQSDADIAIANQGRVVIALPDEGEQELKPQNADALTAAGKRIPVQ